MSGHSDADLLSCLFLNLASYFIRNTRIFPILSLFFKFFFRKSCVFFRNSTFCNCQYGKPFSLFFSLIDGVYYIINIIWYLWYQYDICSSCDSCMKSEPTHFMSHDFNNKYSSMRSCSSMDTINRICRYVHSTLETKSHICSP